MRVSPPKVFGEAVAAGKPPAGSAGAQDAYRQTGFVLGAEVDLVVSGLALEGQVADTSSGAKFRTQVTASALGLWSRSWLSRLQALHALQWGNYTAAMPLVRAAADYQAAQLWLLQTDASEWRDWLDQGGVSMRHEEHAMEYRLHAFRSAEVLVGHEVLGPVYRAATDLSLSHFGTTLLLAGSESTPERVMMTFGDRDFHLGLAEVVFGWLLQLGAAQILDLARFPAAVAPAEDGAAAWVQAALKMNARADRCHVECVERAGETRHLIDGWRRRPGDAAKRIML